MKLNIIKLFLFCIVSNYLMISCNKQDKFLEAKPNQSLTIPTTLKEYQDLINNEYVFNQGRDPGMGTATGEDYYITTDYWNSLGTSNRNIYTFERDIFQSESTSASDWNYSYNVVYYANTVLDGLPTIHISSNEQGLYNLIQGSALFYRSYYLYGLLQTYAMPYDSITSRTDLGIVLKLTSDFNVISKRSTVLECYNRIIEDLKTALTLLPVTSEYKTRPTKLSTNALLARIYLAIGNYTLALKYSSASLSIDNSLDDYNILTPTSASISTNFLNEDIFHATISSKPVFSRRFAAVDSTLLQLYSDDDLRKTLFFRNFSGIFGFRGSYDYLGNKFSGLANDEIYLIRAECYARQGNTSLAMEDLNTLLVKRWMTGTYVDMTAVNADDALNIILTERRKELVFRGTRWTDLRRLNKDDRFKVTLTHIINGTTYILPPNDKRYAMPIPNDEIRLNAIPQNDR